MEFEVLVGSHFAICPNTHIGLIFLKLFFCSFISFSLFRLDICYFLFVLYEILLVPLLGKLKLENLYVLLSVALSLVAEKTLVQKESKSSDFFFPFAVHRRFTVLVIFMLLTIINVLYIFITHLETRTTACLVELCLIFHLLYPQS